MKKILLTLSACVILLMVANADASDADSILGQWFTEGDESVVEIYRCDESYCGKIVWGKGADDPNGEERLDTNNPDESKRNRKLIGMDIVWDFKDKGKNEWGGGKIYDPDNGKTYSCKAKLKGDKLDIRGFVGISFFGRTVIWKRKQRDESVSK